MKKIKLSHRQYALVDDDIYVTLVKYKWYAIKRARHSSYNAECIFREKVNGKWHTRSLYMHRVIMEAKKGQEVDHVNRNGLDNRRQNLRICTHAENMANAKKYRRKIPGFQGVQHDRRDNKYTAVVGHRHVGRFVTGKEAHEAYKKAKKEKYGEFANDNKHV